MSWHERPAQLASPWPGPSHTLTWTKASGTPLTWAVRVIHTVVNTRQAWAALTEDDWKRGWWEWTYFEDNQQWQWCGLPGYRGEAGAAVCVRLGRNPADPPPASPSA